MKIRPLRITAAILALIVAGEIYGILNTPTYEKELAEAKAAYHAAAFENHVLLSAMGK
jgi:hypothetical protein